MNVKILVLYASAKESTKEVAERICTRIRAADPPVGTVIIEPFESAPEPTLLASYDTIIIGSAIHGTAWLPSATKFLSSHITIGTANDGSAAQDTNPATDGNTHIEDVKPITDSTDTTHLHEPIEDRSFRHLSTSLHPRLGIYAFSVGCPNSLPTKLQSAAIKGEEEKIRTRLESVYGLGEHLKSHELFMGVALKEMMPWGFRFIWTWAGGRFGDFREWEKIDGWSDGIVEDLRRGVVVRE